MNLFQYLTLPITIFLFTRSFYHLVSRGQTRVIYLLGAIIWLAASVAILKPELTIKIAGILGIGRGADLVLYLLVIAFLISVFYLYQRLQRVEANITEIVRLLAIQNAVEHNQEMKAIYKKTLKHNRREEISNVE